MDFEDILRNIFQMDRTPTDYSKWQQIGALSAEETLHKRNMLSRADRMAREMGELKARMNVIVAEGELMTKEWWNMLYKNHSLPSERNYQIQPDGRILIEPEKEKPEKPSAP